MRKIKPWNLPLPFPRLAAPTAKPILSPSADKRSMLYDLIAFFPRKGINLWVRTTGKRIRVGDEPWLRCPLGERGRIGTGFTSASHAKRIWRSKLRPEPA